MQYFLVQVSYTSEAWRTLIKEPQNRLESMRPVVENLGGKIESSYLMLGDYDAIGILQMPDAVSSAALSMAIAAGGAVKSVKTVQLMPWDEGLKAMKKAKTAVYRPPETNPMLDRR
jgi:uncharacterized protein with GYD domain